MRRLSVLLAAVVVLGLAAGCRSSQSESATDAVHQFLGALERDDAAGACRRLSEAGVSELLLVALERGVGVGSEARRDPNTCARIVGEMSLAADARKLRQSPVAGVVSHGHKATVHTGAGSYEAENRDGRWLVSRFDPLAAASTVPSRTVGVVVVKPHFGSPALGSTLAHETTKTELEVSGALQPEEARLSARALEGGTVERVESADGRYKLKLRLRPGDNSFELHGDAAGHEPTRLTLRIRRR